MLQRRGYNARAMHSDLEQSERDEVMQLFRSQQIDLLVATDIVARGIDIDDITMVINYDAPHDAEDYVHRIGRTARAGRQGCAVTLIGERDRYGLQNIERTLQIEIPRAELPEGVRPPSSEGDSRKRPAGQRGKDPKREGKQGGEGSSAKRHRGGHRTRPQGAQAAGQSSQPGDQPAAQAATDGAKADEQKKRRRKPRRRKRPAGERPAGERPADERPAEPNQNE